ncbi:MAG: M20/M25/M40 family metallo-hydrolase [Acidobacteriota bacterium]
MTRFLVLLLVACSAGPPGPGLDTDRVLDHVALLAKTPRVHDTDASRAALAYIEHEIGGGERLRVGDVSLSAIDVLGERFREAHVAHTDDPDLLVRFGPPGKALLITAHYDTVPGSPGATDNAVAVGLLIELARELRDHAPAHPVMLAFTADEEDGLVGAEALARDRDDIGFVVALDLLGGDGDLVLNGASTRIGTAEMRWLAHAADRAGMIVRAPLPHRVVSRWWPQLERADHGAFFHRGIRAFHLYNRGNDGDWIDVAYHGPGDVPSRVARGSVDAAGRLVRALVTDPVPAHTSDGFWLPLAANTVIPRAVLLALEIALALAALAGLALLVGPRTRGGLGLVAGTGCFALAVALASLVRHYPGDWLLAPQRHELALTAVIAGGFVLLARVAARVRPWVGRDRYLALALALSLAVGLTLLAAGAAELAWIWLVPAAALALARRWPVAAQASLVPAILVLAPGQLREAAWNGFLPVGLPLAVWLAALGAPAAAALAWALRRRAVRGPLGSLVLAMGCGLAVAAGAAIVLLAHPACSAAEFKQFQLACEQVRTWP